MALQLPIGSCNLGVYLCRTVSAVKKVWLVVVSNHLPYGES
jgi:hypothetical protein